MKDLFKEVLEQLTKIKVLIETLGLLGGIIIIFLTYRSVDMAGKSLAATQETVKLLQDQVHTMNEQLSIERNSILPSWKFDIDNDLKRLQIYSHHEDFELNYITLYCPTDTMVVEMRDKSLNKGITYDFIQEIIARDCLNKYLDDTEYRRTIDRFPIGIAMNYSYRGNMRLDYAIWLLKHSIYWNEEKLLDNHFSIDLYLDNVESYKYYAQNDTIENYLPEMKEVLFNY